MSQVSTTVSEAPNVSSSLQLETVVCPHCRKTMSVRAAQLIVHRRLQKPLTCISSSCQKTFDAPKLSRPRATQATATCAHECGQAHVFDQKALAKHRTKPFVCSCGGRMTLPDVNLGQTVKGVPFSEGGSQRATSRQQRIQRTRHVHRAASAAA